MQVWRDFVTRVFGKGHYARRMGDEAFWRGEVEQRPTVETDLGRNIEVVQVGLFGKPWQAAKKLKTETETWNKFVQPDGRLADNVPEEIRDGLQAGTDLAISDAIGAGMISKDLNLQPSEAGALDQSFGQKLAEARRITGVLTPGTDGAIEAFTTLEVMAVKAADAARVVDMTMGWNDAQEVAEPSDTTVTMYRDGEQVHVDVRDPWIAAYQKETVGGELPAAIAVPARVLAHFFRNNVLTRNLGWQITNIPIDANRTFINSKLFRPIKDLWRMLGLMGTHWVKAAPARRSPIERMQREAELPPGTPEAERLRVMREREESGEIAATGRAQFVKDLGMGDREVIRMGQLLEGDASQRKARQSVWKLLSPVTWWRGWTHAGEVAMNVQDVRTRLQLGDRFRQVHGRPPTRQEVAEMREGTGAPPVEDTFRGTWGAPPMAMQFLGAIVNGNITDGRVHAAPTTRAGAALKAGMTVMAPTAFALMARANMFGGQDDDTGWGCYVRGLQSMPAHRAAAGIGIPTGITRTADGVDECHIFMLPVNRTYQPVINAFASGMNEYMQSEDGRRAVMEGLKGGIAGALPTMTTWGGAAVDTYDFLFGSGNPMGGPDDDIPMLFGTEINLEPIKKGARFFLEHLPNTLGARWVPAAATTVLRLLGKEELLPAREMAAAQGGWLEQAPSLPGIGGVVRRLVPTAAGGGRREFRRGVGETVERELGAERAGVTERMGLALNRMVREHPAPDEAAIHRFAAEFAGDEDHEDYATNLERLARQGLMRYPKYADWRALITAATPEEGIAIIKREGPARARAILGVLKKAHDVGAMPYSRYVPLAMEAERQRDLSRPADR